jgi:hypothetical protein
VKTRFLIGFLGVAAAAYGLVLLVDHGLDDLVAAVIWLAAGVVLHDFFVVPLTLGVCWLGMRVVAPSRRPPLAAGLLVLGALTVLAIPVLGRFGARPDNPTLLDRDYTAGWLVVAGLTLAAVVAGLVVRARTGRRTGGPGTRRR